MLLVVDVGNTQTVLGLFEDQQLGRQWRVATEAHRTGDELGVLVHSLLALEGIERARIEGFALASVVPQLNREYQLFARHYLQVEPLVVGPGIKTGMPVLTNNPREVGADLIVDAVAAHELWGAPCIVVDFGTATTFAAVSERGEYLGHAIAPGIQVAMDALTAQAAKLPRVELIDPGSVIGRNTVHAMQAGAIYGFAGQVDGILRRMRAELGGEATTVATGGLADLIREHSECLDHYDPSLTLRGLEIIHRRNR